MSENSGRSASVEGDVFKKCFVSSTEQFKTQKYSKDKEKEKILTDEKLKPGSV